MLIAGPRLAGLPADILTIDNICQYIQLVLGTPSHMEIWNCDHFSNPSLILTSTKSTIYNSRHNWLPESVIGFTVGPL